MSDYKSASDTAGILRGLVSDVQEVKARLVNIEHTAEQMGVSLRIVAAKAANGIKQGSHQKLEKVPMPNGDAPALFPQCIAEIASVWSGQVVLDCTRQYTPSSEPISDGEGDDDEDVAEGRDMRRRLTLAGLLGIAPLALITVMNQSP